MRVLPHHSNEFNSNGAVPQKMLKDIRKIIKIKCPVQEKINQIVHVSVQALNVDVCSCYIIRPGDVLELYATYGLEPKAVHETFLRVGEGLIGEIALQRKPLSFDNAWEHSSFVYKPETKEDKFHSLMGVPIIHQDVLLGVLCVQKEKVYHFKENQIDSLKIIAMVISDVLLDAFKKSAEKKVVSGRQHKKLEAVCLIPGIAVGKAFVHKRMALDTILASDKSSEQKKLSAALKSVEAEVNQMLAHPHVTGEQTDIFETYLMFTQDRGWITKINHAIESGLTAEASVQKVVNEIAERMSLMTDPYIKERIHDFQDLASRIIRHLRGKRPVSVKKMPKNTILVAKSMGPVELLDYDISKIKAIVLEEGSQTMHVIIIARSLNIPVISGVKDISQIILNEDLLAVDANKGFLYINPSDEVQDSFDESLKVYKKLQTQYMQLKGQPSVTKDGVVVSLHINAGLASDLMNTKGFPYDGIGLYRTELPFMSAPRLPDVQEQTDIYKRVFGEVKNKPIVFRTLDIGSDKVLPYFENKEEQNPAMGWRSIRITLDRRAILRGQLRAFIRACAGKELHIMFPMITTINEFLEAKRTLEIELKREENKGGILPLNIKVGTMLEVPSLLFQLEELVKIVDFISIGTNDLAQFLFATDRGNPLIWNRYDVLSPAFLKTLKHINDICKAAGIPCSVCGEMASRALESFALIGLGFTKLSMNPSALGSVKAVVRTMNQQNTEEFILSHLSDPISSIRPLLRAYAVDHGVFI